MLKPGGFELACGLFSFIFMHIPVRVNEVIAALNLKPNGIYVDCTFGFGGHSREILKQLAPTGKLFAFDVDHNAYKYFQTHFSHYPNAVFCWENFQNLKSVLALFRVYKVDGFLFDLGANDLMFSDMTYGGSFRFDMVLDMRFDKRQKTTAAMLLNTKSYQELVELFRCYGQIKNPTKLVQALIHNRPINTTLAFVNILKKYVPKRKHNQKPHFATKYFQALRIGVNDELNALALALKDALSLLNFYGRIVTLSFHSLEEKTIKNIYQSVLYPTLPAEIPQNNQRCFRLIHTFNKRAS